MNDAFVHRRTDQQAISAGHHGLQLLDSRAVEARMQQIFGGKIPHPQQAHFHLLRFQALAYVIQQQLGARTRRRAAGKQHNMHERCLAMV